MKPKKQIIRAGPSAVQPCGANGLSLAKAQAELRRGGLAPQSAEPPQPQPGNKPEADINTVDDRAEHEHEHQGAAIIDEPRPPEQTPQRKRAA